MFTNSYMSVTRGPFLVQTEIRVYSMKDGDKTAQMYAAYAASLMRMQDRIPVEVSQINELLARNGFGPWSYRGFQGPCMVPWSIVTFLFPPNPKQRGSRGMTGYSIFYCYHRSNC